MCIRNVYLVQKLSRTKSNAFVRFFKIWLSVCLSFFFFSFHSVCSSFLISLSECVCVCCFSFVSFTGLAHAYTYMLEANAVKQWICVRACVWTQYYMWMCAHVCKCKYFHVYALSSFLCSFLLFSFPLSGGRSVGRSVCLCVSYIWRRLISGICSCEIKMSAHT